MAPKCSPCSMVLEGGVTSAVVYASLLARLSLHYCFRQLGGASSGAVAAAAAAAAEFWRQHGSGPPGASFEHLGRFPEVLADDESGATTLFQLFQPAPRGRASFAVAMSALDATGTRGLGATAWRCFMALLAHFKVAALLAALAVAGIGWIVADGLSAHLACGPPIDRITLCAAAWAAVMLPTAISATLALGLWALRVTVRALRDNHWGLCNGMNEAGFQRDALTPTLHQFFQQLAGPLVHGPLTLGDLWWGPQPQDGTPRPQSAERLIDLQIVTSAISLARPVRLPGDPGSNPLREFFYDPKEWEALFPDDVMAHLRTHARNATLRRRGGCPLLALPDPEHWPVLMVVRFSLSFPLLLSALPMYIAVPRREMLRAGAAAKQLPFEARKVYFSDGGITSNCPVHLFDAPLPRFPTFGVNLYPRRRGSGMRVSRSDTRDPSLEAAATPDAATWKTPLPFLWASVSTALGWRDSLQRSLPGYRERIVHIGLPPEAGGLNLAMKRATILSLAKVGRIAAWKLHEDFATLQRSGEANAWERHRWTRARTTLSALRAYLAAFADRVPTGEPDYKTLLRGATPARHPFRDESARQQALDLVEGAQALVRTLESTVPADALDQNTPRPRPALHLSPPW